MVRNNVLASAFVQNVSVARGTGKAFSAVSVGRQKGEASPEFGSAQLCGFSLAVSSSIVLYFSLSSDLIQARHRGTERH